MHELGVVFSIIKTVEQVAEENHVSNVPSVTLELGEVSTVVPDLLTDCWDWAVKRTQVMKEARLEIIRIPAITFCEDCRQEYPTVAHGKICPHCGSGKTYLLQGNEFTIKQITAE
ncbi:MAG: hydrogenase maturation nickel metallochaperone HypA [Clostridia bacterium]|nr:hydrogenase maturation nickel metallochaperone HypA [Clostridia bacterium]